MEDRWVHRRATGNIKSRDWYSTEERFHLLMHRLESEFITISVVLEMREKSIPRLYPSLSAEQPISDLFVRSISVSAFRHYWIARTNHIFVFAAANTVCQIHMCPKRNRISLPKNKSPFPTRLQRLIRLQSPISSAGDDCGHVELFKPGKPVSIIRPL